MQNTESIQTNIKDLVIHCNKIIKDNRGILYRLAHNVESNPNFQGGIKNLIAVTCFDRSMRGSHYHKKANDETFNIHGLGFWIFMDLRKESPTYLEVYGCIAGSGELYSKEFNDVPFFNTIQNNWLAQIHIPKGVYHAVLSVGNEPLTYIHSIDIKYDDSDSYKVDPNTLELLANYLKKYGLNNL